MANGSNLQGQAELYQSSEGAEIVVPFADLNSADLGIDRCYAGGVSGTIADDALARLLPVGNQGGFRYKGSVKSGTVRIAVLYTSGREPDWPDHLSPQTGMFTYYGDNRSPGRVLHDTNRYGNVLLRDVFEATHGSPQDRATVAPFFLFEKAGRGREVRFRGLLAPGGDGVPADTDLTAVWRSKGGVRFQNYRAVFTVLDVGVIPRSWIESLAQGDSTVGPNCPEVWREWVNGRVYTPLVAPPTLTIRTRDEQLPSDDQGRSILDAVHQHFEFRSVDFEVCAVAIWRLIAPATGACQVTPPSRDGGRDAIGEYLIGPSNDRVPMEFSLEAKCYKVSNGVGVKEMSRLISRIRHRQFGVFVTLSYFRSQVYKEVRMDGHPIVMISGGDVVDALRANGYGDVASVLAWLNSQFPTPIKVDPYVEVGFL
ncbi:restriction endonuclease [Nocardia sp. NPDC058519]|uniref:restriction endonuclease n=1 Tax=Nocardia sp. NPDC058519 TaxID=3346535 RepID=UPI003664D9D6